MAQVTSNRMGSAKYLFQDDFSSRSNWQENCFLYFRDSGFYQADRRYRWRTALRANCKMKLSTRFGGDTFAKRAQRALARTV